MQAQHVLVLHSHALLLAGGESLVALSFVGNGVAPPLHYGAHFDPDQAP